MSSPALHVGAARVLGAASTGALSSASCQPGQGGGNCAVQLVFNGRDSDDASGLQFSVALHRLTEGVLQPMASNASASGSSKDHVLTSGPASTFCASPLGAVTSDSPSPDVSVPCVPPLAVACSESHFMDCGSELPLGPGSAPPLSTFLRDLVVTMTGPGVADPKLRTGPLAFDEHWQASRAKA